MNQSNDFEDVALNVDTDKTQNLELLLDADDFAEYLAMEDFKHYDLHKTTNRIGSGLVMVKVSCKLIQIPGGTTL